MTASSPCRSANSKLLHLTNKQKPPAAVPMTHCRRRYSAVPLPVYNLKIPLTQVIRGQILNFSLSRLAAALHTYPECTDPSTRYSLKIRKYSYSCCYAFKIIDFAAIINDRFIWRLLYIILYKQGFDKGCEKFLTPLTFLSFLKGIF